MPQQGGGGGAANSKKKKQKGHAPAHQNKFAFRHNPKSKTTEKILASPNVHVCRRCHEKIEWRKTYRKYKPLSQPSKCNLCCNKNVKAAYHTICSKCSQHSAKAQALLAAWNEERQEKDRMQQQQHDGEDKKADGEQSSSQEAAVSSAQETALTDTTSNATEPDTDTQEARTLAPSRVLVRVCCICVKEPALPASDDEIDEDDASSNAPKKLSLRERKTLERQQQRSKKGNIHKKTLEAATTTTQRDEGGDHPTVQQPNNNNNTVGSGLVAELGLDNSDDDESDEDPFLNAIGGQENMLTGEAYQKRVLEQEQQQQQQGQIDS